jgi:diguanylate cyclase (GGDEF)-like protein
VKPLTTNDELVPITERLNALLGLRLLAVAMVIIVPLIAGDANSDLAPVTAGYLALIVLAELVRRRLDRRATWLVSLNTLVDAAFLTFAIGLTGGYWSSLLFLVFLYVTGVTLLVSHRTGLKVAVWCALLLFLGSAASGAGLISLELPSNDRDAALTALAFLLFAIGAALCSSVNERALRRSRAQLSALVDLDIDLERAAGRDAAALALARHTCEGLGFRRAVVLVRGDDDTWSAFVVDDSLTGEWMPCEAPGRHGLDVLRTRSPVLLRDLMDDPSSRFLPGAVNVVLAAICADDDDLGLLISEWGGRPNGRIPMLTVRALQQAAQHAGLALRHRALLEEVQRLATRDAATGLANRRLLEETLDHELGRVRRHGTPLSALVIDVDHFKLVNDSGGHLVGDQVLRELGAVFEANVKAYDLVARWGGDEFVVLLPGCSSTDGGEVADRLRAAVREADTAAPVTVSVGVATIPQHALDGRHLFGAADAALYVAKNSGRDRSVISDRRLTDEVEDKLAV